MTFFLSLLLAWNFPEIVEAIPEGPFCYPGKNPREVICVIPKQSPLLEIAVNALITRLHNGMSEQEILSITMQFIKDELFSSDNCNETALQQLIASFEGNEPEISLEVFLREKTGICRHIALTATYLLDQLSKKNILNGTAFLIREDTPFGRHAWTLFLSKTSSWHLDVCWGILENGKTKKGYTVLSRYYGKEVMIKQKQKWEKGSNED